MKVSRAIAKVKISAAASNTRSDVVFLHISSCFPRKGVDVLVDAYTEAFTENDQVRLIIKGIPSPHNRVAELIEWRRHEIPGAPPITFLNEDMSSENLVALYLQADAMVLPTRGEGLNLPAAEAIAANLRLIVRGYGGQMDFLSQRVARLVDYTFEQSRTHLSTPGSVWCEPNRTDLVKAFRETFTSIKAEVIRARFQTVGRRSRRGSTVRLSPTELKKRYRQCLCGGQTVFISLGFPLSTCGAASLNILRVLCLVSSVRVPKSLSYAMTAPRQEKHPTGSCRSGFQSGRVA